MPMPSFLDKFTALERMLLFTMVPDYETCCRDPAAYFEHRRLERLRFTPPDVMQILDPEAQQRAREENAEFIAYHEEMAQER